MMCMWYVYIIDQRSSLATQETQWSMKIKVDGGVVLLDMFECHKEARKI